MKKKTAFAAAVVLLIGVMLFSVWKICTILSQYRESAESYEDLRSLVISASAASPAPSEDAAISASELSPAPLPEEMPYPADCPTIDFAPLRELSGNVIGWIYSEGTPINYPIMQADDNGTYLHAAPDGSYLYAGSIYADCRCVPAFACENTVIYGHRMADGSMFASLRDYRDASYYPGHSELWIITDERPYRAVVIAGAVVAADDEIYKAIDDADSVAENVRRIIENSTFKSDAEWDGKAPIVTLSTCTYEFDNARYVLICMLE